MAKQEQLSMLIDTGRVKVHVPEGLSRYLKGDSLALQTFREQILAAAGTAGFGRSSLGCRSVGPHRIHVEVQKTGGDCATVLCASA